jgi:hypothetical protein
LINLPTKLFLASLALEKWFIDLLKDRRYETKPSVTEKEQNFPFFYFENIKLL